MLPRVPGPLHLHRVRNPSSGCPWTTPATEETTNRAFQLPGLHHPLDHLEAPHVGEDPLLRQLPGP